VPKEEIVSGFEYSKGQYVIVDPDELDKLRTPDEKAITISTFIEPDNIDLLNRRVECGKPRLRWRPERPEASCSLAIPIESFDGAIPKRAILFCGRLPQQARVLAEIPRVLARGRFRTQVLASCP
jgi:hypothetical protein